MSMQRARTSRPLVRRNVLTRSSRFGPNMTPMVDVTLVILIFFMASASIVGHEWFLRAQLPEVQDPDLVSSGFSLPTPMLSAALFVRDGAVLVGGFGDEPRPLGTVIGQIQHMDAGLADGLILEIRAGDEVPYAAVVSLHEAAARRKMIVAIR